jgi:hypothetical protein
VQAGPGVYMAACFLLNGGSCVTEMLTGGGGGAPGRAPFAFACGRGRRGRRPAQRPPLRLCLCVAPPLAQRAGGDRLFLCLHRRARFSALMLPSTRSMGPTASPCAVQQPVACVTRVASLLSSLPGSWPLWVRRCYMPRSLLAVGWRPPLMGGLRPGITSWVVVVRLNALIRSSLNRQLCELPAASHAAVQVKGSVAPRAGVITRPQA